MAEVLNPNDSQQSATTPVNTKDSPPRTPPSPDENVNDGEVKLSRKREREVSLEPAATTPRSQLESDPLRTPAKKNRTVLGSTREEDDRERGGSGSRSPSRSPPLGKSPPQEIKMQVRQISQGVEDLTWRSRAVFQGDAGAQDSDMDPPTITAPHGDNAGSGQAATAPADAAPADQALPDDAQAANAQVPQDDIVDSASSNGIDAAATPAVEVSAPEAEVPKERRSSDSDGSEDAKSGVKRKFLERGTSVGPQENGDASKKDSGVEPLKRPRDEPDQDPNPRETKRPSPPPDKQPVASTSTPKPALSGFMAYASTSSPFASVKGKNIFTSTSTKASSPGPVASLAPSPFSSAATEPPSSVTSTPTAAKRTGFEAFASSASPFATAAARAKSPSSPGKLSRAKSPSRRANPANINAFSAYASGGMQGFAVPHPKRARAGSPGDSSSRSSLERPSGAIGAFDAFAADSGAEDDREDRTQSFGEKLRAGKDDSDEARSEEEEPRVALTEQDLTTGEEDETTMHQVRGKLFSLANSNQWKERGTGTLKLLVRYTEKGSTARLVMRKEAVYTVILNVTLFPGMRCTLAQDPRYLRFSVIENGNTTHYNLRLASAKVAQEVLTVIQDQIPTA
ncbi:hypothetical protein HGRIS_005114 [Hohenbuehelia grisea]|uniref:RanBD1 domain-containing protein n=1 Tax=Hohenbuehelia grisea TaxID=104357 RepID=A0ABR3JEV8_9AGAR